MLDNLSAAKRFRQSIQLTAAIAALLAVAPAARAQGLFSLFSAPSPYDIERRLDASGYELTGPLVRRGNVWLADVVVSGRGDPERLVIDPQSGRIIERFRIRPARWRQMPPRDADMAPGYMGAQNGAGPQNEMPPQAPMSPGWGGQNNPPPQNEMGQGAWGGEPRPPADVGQPAPLRDQFARGDDPAGGAGGPRTTSDLGAPRATPDVGAPRATFDSGVPVDTQRPKPHEAKRKSPPVVSKAPAVSTASAGPAATAPAPAPVHQPAAATVAAPAPTSAVTAKSESAPPPAPAKAPAPDGKSATKTKPVNDLPVTPLD